MNSKGVIKHKGVILADKRCDKDERLLRCARAAAGCECWCTCFENRKPERSSGSVGWLVGW